MKIPKNPSSMVRHERSVCARLAIFSNDPMAYESYRLSNYIVAGGGARRAFDFSAIEQEEAMKKRVVHKLGKDYWSVCKWWRPVTTLVLLAPGKDVTCKFCLKLKRKRGK